MSTSAVNRDEYDKMHDEHEEVRAKLRRIHDVFKGMIQAPRDIKALLDEFEETLVMHFAHEEMDGFFDAVIRQAPSLAGEANRLCMEHHLLRNQIADLSRFAASGSPIMPWWRELAARCHVLSQKLMQHESAENALLHMACRHDVGVLD